MSIEIYLSMLFYEPDKHIISSDSAQTSEFNGKMNPFLNSKMKETQFIFGDTKQIEKELQN